MILGMVSRKLQAVYEYVKQKNIILLLTEQLPHHIHDYCADLPDLKNREARWKT